MRVIQTQEEIISSWQKDANKPLISICCITYNHESYIKDTLEGFLMQETNFPFEILIHDDASTDKTADLIRQYEAKYPLLIKPIYQTENKYSKGIKINSTFNFPRSQGEYIALCEGDDFWTDKDKLQYQIEKMREHSECQLSFHPTIFLNTLTMNTSIERRHAEHNKVFSTKEIIQGDGGFCPTASLIIKKEAIQNLPMFVENAPVGDYFLQIFGSVKGGALYIDRTMSTYRIQPNGVWTSMVNNFKPLKKFIIKFSETLQEMDTFFDFQYQDEIASVRNHHFFTFIGNTKFSLLDRIDFYNNYKNHLSIEQQIKQLQVLFDEQAKVNIENENHHKHNMNTTQKELNSLQHKYHVDIETVQNKLDTTTNRYNLMMKSISNLIEVPSKRKPLQKISAYKSLTKTYFKLRKEENEKK